MVLSSPDRRKRREPDCRFHLCKSCADFSHLEKGLLLITIWRFDRLLYHEVQGGDLSSALEHFLLIYLLLYAHSI
ncbi:hypothetical protein L6164_032530 [Bauhinia variegata]|uniref:Uncharacterized protein n=1 Tax=Bauhinia variegata TaxID=167791 RepID=A0ACB9KP04_BAUVA|nr:hypothetical protein L6164_032530 [Bauhinia variegata]